MRGMLVAAGFGTRLAPLTDEVPKPAVPVANRPLAAYAMQHLCAGGVTELVANTHHLPEALQRALTPWVPPGARLAFVHEPEILGTGGGVRNAWRDPDAGPFVVMNAKLLFAPDLAAMLQVHARHGALATLVLLPMPPGAGFGPIDVDAGGRVRAILSADPQPAPGLRRCLFTGVYVLHPRAHARLPERGCFVRQGLIPWLREGACIMAHLDAAPFADLGRSLAAYHGGNLALLEGRRGWPGVDPDPATRSLVAPGAVLASGCRLSACAIGAGARLGDVQLERVVVWPGARVEASLSDAIVTGEGRVVRPYPASDRAPR